MPQQYDEFDDPEQEGMVTRMMNAYDGRKPMRARKPVFALSVVGGLALVLAGVLYVSYPRGGAQPDSADVPIIRADAGPVKTAPDSQGGMEIPNRDSTVFNSIRGKTPDAKVENLLPQTEQPVNRAQVFAGLPPAQQAADMNQSAQQMAQAAPASGQTVAQSETKPADVAKEAVKDSTPAPATATPQTTAPATTQVEAPAVPSPATAVPAPAPVATPPAAPKATEASGSSYVQLASMKDKTAAAGTWKNLQKQYPAQLGGAQYRVSSANVKGATYYRVQAGPFSADKAKTVCKEMNAKKTGACLVASH